ncbi:MAG TPA: hypothetical protein VF167_17300 [Longimicrobiaceae bacterium]
MAKLLLHAGVFALFTLIVYFVCMWFVRVEERKQERRSQARR